MVVGGLLLSLGLPSRIVDILEGESLLNDATGLLALEFAVGILVENVCRPRPRAC
jgi:NhaP-type Na+/H+ or K+/H+ antiporter